jgi:predicted TIM-barrel fold metal-dependent hydrolase
MLDLSGMPLVDQHCHGVVADPIDEPGFVRLLTESRHPLPHAGSWFDTQLGLAVRAWCPPLIGMAPHASPGDYLARRTELGTEELNRRLLGSTGITDYLVDTGLDGSLLLPPRIAAVSGSRAYEVVRLETIAEHVAGGGTSAAGFAAAFAEALGAATRTAVALKSVVAYRHGLDLDPARPSANEVRAAAVRWLASIEATGDVRLTDPVLLRHVLWTGLETGLPLQLHTGFGDADLTLNRSDPALLTPFLRAVESTGVAVILLHCYPYHRNAAYLAHVFPHVHVDVGLTLTYVGTRAGAVLAETLELAPFAKVLFSTDAYGLPELYVVGAALFRQQLQRLLTGWVAEDACTLADAERIAGMIASGNARQIYRLA